MDGTFVFVREVAVVLVALLGGGAVVPVVNWLKETFRLQGYAAVALTVFISVLMGAAGLIAEGQLTPESVRLDNFSDWFLLVFLSSQVVFRMLQDRATARANRIRETVG